MRAARRIVDSAVSLGMLALFGSAYAQRTGEPTAMSPISAPDPLKGIWEAPDGNGGAVGLNLWTASSNDWQGEERAEEGPMKPLPGPGHPVLEFGVYHRAKAHVRCMEENFFDTAWRGKQDLEVVDTYAGGHLVVHTPDRKNPEFVVDLDLWLDPWTHTWTGRFHRGSFDQQVTLRPAPPRPSHDGGLCRAKSVFWMDPDAELPKTR